MDVWGLIEQFFPIIITTLGLTALAKGYVAKLYKVLVGAADKAPPWVTRVLALVVGVLYAASQGDETLLPEITDGSIGAVAAMILAWIQARVGESDSG